MLTSFPTDFFLHFFEKPFLFHARGGEGKKFCAAVPGSKREEKETFVCWRGGEGGDFLEVADSAAARVEETEVHL